MMNSISYSRGCVRISNPWVPIFWDEFEVKIGNNAKFHMTFSLFYLFYGEIHDSNVFFYCIWLSILSKSMGSGTLLQNVMGSKEPMEPMLTQSLCLQLYKEPQDYVVVHFIHRYCHARSKWSFRPP